MRGRFWRLRSAILSAAAACRPFLEPLLAAGRGRFGGGGARRMPSQPLARLCVPLDAARPHRETHPLGARSRREAAESSGLPNEHGLFRRSKAPKRRLHCPRRILRIRGSVFRALASPGAAAGSGRPPGSEGSRSCAASLKNEAAAHRFSRARRRRDRSDRKIAERFRVNPKMAAAATSCAWVHSRHYM